MFTLIIVLTGDNHMYLYIHSMENMLHTIILCVHSVGGEMSAVWALCVIIHPLVCSGWIKFYI